MAFYTLVATGQTDATPAAVEAAVRDTLASVGFTLVPCGWAPDLDTVADYIGDGVDYGSNGLIDLN